MLISCHNFFVYVIDCISMIFAEILDEFGGNFSVSIWDEIMNIIYENTAYGGSDVSFSVPDNVQALTYDRTTGMTDVVKIKSENAETGWFLIDGE